MNDEFSDYTNTRAQMILDIRDGTLSFEETLTWFKNTEEFRPVSHAELVSWLFSWSRIKSGYKYQTIKNDKAGQLLIKNRLKRIYTALHPNADGDKTEGFMRTVRNWFSGIPHLPTGHKNSREQLIWIAFAFGITPEQANRFLLYCREDALYALDLRDAVFIYCLKTGRNRMEAQQLIDALELEKLNDGQTDSRPYDCEDEDGLTQLVCEELRRVENNDDFMIFVKQNRRHYRRIRQSAVRYISNNFVGILRLTALTKEFKTKIETAEADGCLRDRIAKLASSYGLPVATMDKLYRAFCEDWLTEEMLYRIGEISDECKFKGRVKRSQVLLAYMLTEGTYWMDKSPGKVIRNEKPDKAFNENFRQLNGILQDYGMARLDPRNPFDWLIMYCLRPGESDCYMKNKLESALEYILCLSSDETSLGDDISDT